LSFDSDLLDPADLRPESLRNLRDWLAFQWAMGLQPVSAAELLRATGNPLAALEAGAPPRRARPEELDKAIALLRGVGAKAIPLPSLHYPQRIARLRDPALLLCVRGDVGVLAGPCVSIVGSRAATSYGLAVARELAADLARAGVVVVSGLALGIDAAAHRGALEAGGRTIAVLACGADRVYPARHRQLAAEIVGNGAIVSELPPGTAPLPQFFPLRNRLISALASAVVIVEARERSGSLITAGHAANQGVDVFAVPGPIHAPTSAGPNRLLKEGAFLVSEVSDILAELGLPAPLPLVQAGARSAASEADPDSRSRAILDSLGREPATADELGRRLGCAPSLLALDLLKLELARCVVRARDGRWQARTRSGGGH
jgi:DNA processing protein